MRRDGVCTAAATHRRRTCNRWPSSTDAWVRRGRRECIQVDSLHATLRRTLTVGYFGAAGSSSMAAARSALPVAGCWGAMKAVAPVSARAMTTDLRCRAVRVMPHEYLAQRSLLHRDECVTFKVLNTRLMVDVLAFGTQHQQSHVRCGIRTPSDRIHQVQHGWQWWKTAGSEAERADPALLRGAPSKGENPERRRRRAPRKRKN